MKFVKDGSPWGSAIGLRIETLGTAAIQATEEWFKIRGGQPAPRGGFYDLRVTAELWETYYYDHLSLMVVDHPAGTEVFVDERFAVPQPPRKGLVTDPPAPRPRPAAAAAGRRPRGGRGVWAGGRCAVPQPPLRVFVTAPPRPLAGATDHRGADVSG